MNLKTASGWVILQVLSPYFCAAQSYTISPGTNVSTNVQMNEWGELKIEMKNLLGHDPDLYWETLMWNIPAEWTITLCDYAGCWSDNLIPQFRRMDPIPPAFHGFLEIQNENKTARKSFVIAR